jgi:sialate O-acetylesterase
MIRSIITRKAMVLTAGFLFLSLHLTAEVTLPQVIGSHMVLQRNAPVKIWGWADKGERVTVTMAGQSVRTKTNKEGKWEVILGPMAAGGPFEMQIEGKNSLTLEDVLVGDVWICSGQSNMEWPVYNSDNAEEEVSGADYPRLRLFDVPHNVRLMPVDDIPEAQWAPCTPESVYNFSAVGYFFGRDLHRELDVPIGLISTNWGGTNVETWTSREMSMTDPEMKAGVESIDGMNIEAMAAKQEQERRELLASLGELGSGTVDGEPVWAREDLDLSNWNEMEVPGLWEGKGLPGVDGVVWFRKTVTLNGEQAGSDALLSLGAIDDSDRTWINGVEVGHMQNQYDKARIYRIDPGILKEGVNTIAVRVEDTGGGGGFWGSPEEMFLKAGDRSVPLSGVWLFRVSSEGFRLNAQSTVNPNSKPTLLFNGMIHPLLNYRVLGAIWYQGESNAGRAYRYRTLFSNLIRDWRNQWENPDMGFYFVQLANYMQPKDEPGESEWAELREAQTMALSLPKTGMAVTIDIGNANDIHPRNKQDVGKRLALAALHGTYGKEVVYSGPVFQSMKMEGNRAILEFDPMGTGLEVRDKYGYVKGFAIAGEDQVFHWARGLQQGNSIILWSDRVETPVAVRYGWADNPDDVNLYNQEGLPASPFRTDQWPGITADR